MITSKALKEKVAAANKKLKVSKDNERRGVKKKDSKSKIEANKDIEKVLS